MPLYKRSFPPSKRKRSNYYFWCKFRHDVGAFSFFIFIQVTIYSLILQGHGAQTRGPLGLNTPLGSYGSIILNTGHGVLIGMVIKLSRQIMQSNHVL